MGITDFKLKWALGKCHIKPVYISSKKLIIPCDFFMKTVDVSDNHQTYHFEPAIQIQCCCSLPELGVMAISERKKNTIFVLKYPEMSKISILERVDHVENQTMVFVGLEFLLSAQFKTSFEFELWKWSTGEKLQNLFIPLSHSENLDLELLINPLCLHQIAAKRSGRLDILEVKESDDDFYFHSNHYVLKEKNGAIVPERHIHFEIISQLQHLTIQNFCWLPQNQALVATSKGILKLGLEDTTVQKLVENEAVVSSMTLSKLSIYIGYKTGIIDVVNIGENQWNVMNTINFGEPIMNIFMSPDYNYLTITTPEGSVCTVNVTDGHYNIKNVYKADIDDEIGVGVLGPMSYYYVVAKRNGVLYIIRAANGMVYSTFQFDEYISSMATSPSCYLVAIGSNIGFLYFVDCSNPLQPRIVHCEKPYDLPIEILKFDNFGRYLVTSTLNQTVKLWNAIPSSGFAFLGFKKVSAAVKDLAIFCQASTEDTFLFILTEGESLTGRKTEDVLLRLKLPVDFISNSKQYQVDLFGALSDSTLCFQKRELNFSSSKITMNWIIGALFYCPQESEIRRCDLLSDFTNSKQEVLLINTHVTNFCASSNQQWLTTIDSFGCIHLYNVNAYSVSLPSTILTCPENIRKSYIDFPLLSNNLVCARENEVIEYYEWSGDFPCQQTIPEWVAHCYSVFKKENDYLHCMNKEDTVNFFPENVSGFDLVLLSETYHDLEATVYILNFKLRQLVDDYVSEDEIPPSKLILYSDFLPKFVKENRKKIFFFLPVDIANEVKATLEKEEEKKVESISSVNLGLSVENYSKIDIDRDKKQIENLISFQEVENSKNIKLTQKNFSSTFCKTVRFKYKEEMFSSTKKLLDDICKLKTEYNEEFYALFNRKTSVSDKVYKSYSEAKILSQSLPSKAERDFWSASVESSSKNRNLSSKISPEISSLDCNFKKCLISETKASIENQLKSAETFQEIFDAKVDILRFKKRFCDYSILRDEIEVCAMLLSTIVNDEFANWKNKVETEMEHLKSFDSELDSLVEEAIKQRESVKEVFLKLQNLERNAAQKIENKLFQSGEILCFSKNFPLSDEYTQNPFFGASKLINTEEFSSMLAEFNSRIESPKISDWENISDWEKICSKQQRIFVLGIALRHFQNQLLFITDTKHMCEDYQLQLKETIKINQAILKLITLLDSTFIEKFQSFLSLLPEKTSLKLENDFGDGESISLSSLPVTDRDNQLWNSMEQKTSKIQAIKQQLDEIDELFKHLTKFKSEMNIKYNDIKDKHPKLIQSLKEKLDEAKQNLKVTKSATEECLDRPKILKNSKLNVLKSHFLKK